MIRFPRSYAWKRKPLGGSGSNLLDDKEIAMQTKTQVKAGPEIFVGGTD